MLRTQDALPQRLGWHRVDRGTSNQVTELLVRWRDGDQQALDTLVPLVYAELRKVAHRYLQRESDRHTLQSTALVHEAYLRLAGQDPPEWQNRAHFFAVAAQLMRQILVDHARARRSAKRGGGACTLILDEGIALPKKLPVDMIALDDALQSLAKLDAQQSRIVELRFFAGLSIEDTANVLGISSASVKRYWIAARAWLYHEMSGEASA